LRSHWYLPVTGCGAHFPTDVLSVIDNTWPTVGVVSHNFGVTAARPSITTAVTDEYFDTEL
jgi:hypothetical protein